MKEKYLNTSEEETFLKEMVTTPYKYGFTTDIATEEFEKGLNLEIVKKLSRKKNEPQFLLQFRKKAFNSWSKMVNPQ